MTVSEALTPARMAERRAAIRAQAREAHRAFLRQHPPPRDRHRTYKGDAAALAREGASPVSVVRRLLNGRPLRLEHRGAFENEHAGLVVTLVRMGPAGFIRA